MYDQAMEFMAEDLGNKVGEIERFMEVSENFMEGVDLQNGRFEEEGWALLEEWEEEDSFLFGDEKKAMLESTEKVDFDKPMQKQNPATRQNQFSNLHGPRGGFQGY